MTASPLALSLLVACAAFASWLTAAAPVPSVPTPPALPAEARPVDIAVDPRALVAAAYDRIQKILAEEPDEVSMREKVKALTVEFVDFDEFSRETLRGTWESLDARKRTAFIDGFRRLIQATYARNFKPRRDLTIAWRGDTQYAEDKAQVATTLSFDSSAVDVDYRFHKRADGRWWAYDIVIDEVSLMRNYRGQFRRIVQKDGFDALMVKISAAVVRKEKGADATDDL